MMDALSTNRLRPKATRSAPATGNMQICHHGMSGPPLRPLLSSSGRPLLRGALGLAKRVEQHEARAASKTHRCPCRNARNARAMKEIVAAIMQLKCLARVHIRWCASSPIKAGTPSTNSTFAVFDPTHCQAQARMHSPDRLDRNQQVRARRCQRPQWSELTINAGTPSARTG